MGSYSRKDRPKWKGDVSRYEENLERPEKKYIKWLKTDEPDS